MERLGQRESAKERRARYLIDRDDAYTAVGYDTPQTVPDPFANLPHNPSPAISLSGAGFRVAGAGGLANLASILGASGIASGLNFKSMEDSDDEDDDELHIVGEDEVKGSGGPSRDTQPEASVEEVEEVEKDDVENEIQPRDRFMDDKALKSDTKPQDITAQLVSTSGKPRAGI